MRPATSVYLDLLRIVAAATVFVSHAYPRRLTGGVPALWRAGDLGNDAVMVFFVLSGFVIAHVAQGREGSATAYASSRLARLYSVVVPAIVLTLAADALGTRLAPSLYDAGWYEADRPVWRVAANLLFVNELWFNSVRLFSNVPFWSLGYEFWYYLLFGAAMFLRGWVRALVLVVLLLVVGPKIVLLLPVWLMGVWAHRRTRAGTLAAGAGTALLLGSLLAYVLFRQVDGHALLEDITVQWLGAEAVATLGFSRWFLGSWLVGMLVALHLVGVDAAAPRLARLLPARPIRYLASFTFALYLFHYPLLFFFAAWLEHAGLSAHRNAIVIPATLATVWVLGGLTERRKAALRRWLTPGVSLVVRGLDRRAAQGSATR